MKAEEIVKKLLEHGLAMEDPVVLDAAQCFAEEIAKLCESENERLKAEMGKAQDLLGAAYGLLKKLQ